MPIEGLFTELANKAFNGPCPQAMTCLSATAFDLP